VRYIFLFCLVNCSFVWAQSPYEQDCSGNGGFSPVGSIVLTIDTAFNGQTSYRLNRSVWKVEGGSENNLPKEQIEYSLIVKDTNTNIDSEKRKSTRTTKCENIEISKNEYEKLLSLYKASLKVDFFDYAEGLDGSTWCIEINEGGLQERKLCFWSPDYKSKERNLVELVNLGNYLFKFSESKKSK